MYLWYIFEPEIYIAVLLLIEMLLRLVALYSLHFLTMNKFNINKVKKMTARSQIEAAGPGRQNAAICVLW